MEYQYHIFSPYRVYPLGAHVDHQIHSFSLAQRKRTKRNIPPREGCNSKIGKTAILKISLR